ncbi:hypothetical protein BV22DRAFT_1052505 [Leucogyrophana mollusca]|uniref:Uncharacterized protein n=1 Tax=Leucogyrophana mollusca TaxID=85980 RepID=A0ACB8AVD0_9AGAM|nr:hypothetical protein BV22DRAFT_1052505 [Leucogyrophana mollusca]
MASQVEETVTPPVICVRFGGVAPGTLFDAPLAALFGGNNHLTDGVPVLWETGSYYCHQEDIEQSGGVFPRGFAIFFRGFVEVTPRKCGGSAQCASIDSAAAEYGDVREGAKGGARRQGGHRAAQEVPRGRERAQDSVGVRKQVREAQEGAETVREGGGGDKPVWGGTRRCGTVWKGAGRREKVRRAQGQHGRCQEGVRRRERVQGSAGVHEKVRDSVDGCEKAQEGTDIAQDSMKGCKNVREGARRWDSAGGHGKVLEGGAVKAECEGANGGGWLAGGCLELSET